MITVFCPNCGTSVPVEVHVSTVQRLGGWIRVSAFVPDVPHTCSLRTEESA